MSNDWKIEKGKKIRVSTYSSDFEGIIEKYENWRDSSDYLLLNDTEEIYDFSDQEGALCPQRRKVGRVKIPSDKIHHYEFIEED